MSSIPTKYNKAWRFWALGYLKSAKVNIDFLLNQPNIGRTQYFPDLDPIYSLTDGHFIVATIWTIKHALELILKALSINVDSQYKPCHNLSDLIKELETKMSELCIKEHFTMFSGLTKKYLDCEFSEKTKFQDLQNTLFKYPETKCGNTLDYSFVHDLKKSDLINFSYDIHNLERLASLLEAQISSFRSAQNLGIDKSKHEEQLKKLNTVKNPGFK